MEKVTAEAREEEMEPAKILTKILQTDQFHDVTLRGTDGVTVSASRNILAAGSEVFERMFYGGFSESTTTSEIPLDYKGTVIQAVVEYIHTNDAKILNAAPTTKKRKHDSSDSSSSPEKIDDSGAKDQLEELVSLTTAGAYFALPGLARKAEEAAAKLLNSQKNPGMCLICLDFCRKHGPSVPTSLVETVLKRVRSTKKCHFTKEMVAGLSLDVMKEIVQDEHTAMSELDLFEILSLWTQQDTGGRAEAATEMVTNHVKLEKIDPVSLSTTVASSVLIMPSQLCEAYKKQALASHAKSPIYSQQPRHGKNLWKKSMSSEAFTPGRAPETDILEYQPISTGVHQWTMKVLRKGILRMGIICSRCFCSDTLWIGNTFGSWGIIGARAFANGSPRPGFSFHFTDGDQLRFILDLKPTSDGNGTLTVSKHGSDADRVHLFSNLRDHLRAYPGGFLPAVSTYFGARVASKDVCSDSGERPGLPHSKNWKIEN